MSDAVDSSQSSCPAHAARFHLPENHADEMFHELLEAAPDAMIITDQLGVIELANAQAEKLFGHSRATMTGQSIEMLMPMRYRERHEAHRNQFKPGSPARPMGIGMELVALHASGLEVPVEISLGHLGMGEDRKIICAVRDITQRKAAEQHVRQLNAELEMRVEQRTAELREQIAQRKRLEQEVITISELEQQRIGQDLHDDLGQQLAGASCLAVVLERRLKARQSKDAEPAMAISELLQKAVSLTRSLARGLHPVVAESLGIMAALRDLALHASEMFKVNCTFDGRKTVAIADNTMATHLYRIAQEAVTNAVKHGAVKSIRIGLHSDGRQITLTVRDDGRGIGPLDQLRHGMGLRIMRYRADMIGGALGIANLKTGGTEITCTMPERGVKKPVKESLPMVEACEV